MRVDIDLLRSLEMFLGLVFENGRFMLDKLRARHSYILHLPHLSSGEAARIVQRPPGFVPPWAWSNSASVVA